ncbi:MAG TPA: YfhO family protein [Thermoanaerobaculia bacterium]|jgi:hypothetical protein|nr:YfhO family protein [Thermoanaerobaculia bacterium]
MLGSLGVCALLTGVAFGVGGVAWLLGRKIPTVALASFFVLACLPFPRAFVTDRTPLPLDHIPLAHPWLPLGVAVQYNPYLNDITTQMLPWTQAVRLAWDDGALPLRDRWNGCGTPLAANSQSAAFSLFTLLTLPLPLLAAFLLLGAAKLGIAMAGMWLWVVELRVSRTAAYFAALAFGLSMTFTQWVFFPQTAVLCLWPWIVFLLERSRDPDGRTRTLLGLSLVLAMAALAGHPETLALGVLFAGLWIVVRWILRDVPDAGRLMVRLAAAGAAAAGMTAFLLLPSIFAIRASNRLVLALTPYWEPLLSAVPHGPVWPGVLTAFFPYALGDLIHARVLAGATGAIPEMDLGYFGIVGWAAAALLLRPGSRRPRTEWALIALLVCGLAIAVAQWPFAEIFALVPAIRNMFPLRFYSWVALAGPAVAAFELDRYARDVESRPWTALTAAAIPLALAASAILVYKHLRNEHAAAGDVAFQRSEALVAVAVLLVAAALLSLMRGRPGAAMVSLALLGAGELAYQWHDQYRLCPPSLLYPETPMIRFLRSQPGSFRVAGENGAMFPNMGVFAGVEDVRTHDAVERRDYVTFLDATCGYPPADYFKHIGNPDASVFDFLNVRYMIAPPGGGVPGARWRTVYSGRDGNVYENASVLPRAFVPNRVRLVAAPPHFREPIENANAAFGPAFSEIAANRDWRARAWLLWGSDGEAPGGHAELSGYEESTNTIAFRARVSGGPTAVVLSVVQDGGWSARDGNGAKVELRRANGPFLAAVLLPGDHAVRLTYRPPGFAAGVVVSVAAAVAIALVLLTARARR